MFAAEGPIIVATIILSYWHCCDILHWVTRLHMAHINTTILLLD